MEPDALTAAREREEAARLAWERAKGKEESARRERVAAECEYFAAIQATRLAEERAAAGEQPVVVRLGRER